MGKERIITNVSINTSMLIARAIDFYFKRPPYRFYRLFIYSFIYLFISIHWFIYLLSIHLCYLYIYLFIHSFIHFLGGRGGGKIYELEYF